MQSLVLSAALLLLLSSCAPGLARNDDPIEPQWSSEATSASRETLQGWWQQFDDRVLIDLIDRGVARNPDLAMAAARVREALGLARSADAGRWPTVNAAVASSTGRTAAEAMEPTWEGTGMASFELDLFGRVAGLVNAADASAEAMRADHDWVRLSLIGEIARRYIDYRASAKQVLFAERNQSSERRTQAHVRRQFNAGLVARFDVERIELAAHQSEARVAERRSQKKLALLRLATLTAMPVAELAEVLGPVREIPGLDLVPLTLAPAAVLAERPDVRAANLRLEQQTALKVSEAVSVFPSISLTALFGVAAPVFANPVAIWNVAGGIAMNLLDFGRLGGRIDAAAAREAEAYAAWRKAVLLAIEDVEGALTTAARTKEQRVALEAARKHASSALALAETRYRAGESSLLEVLDSQRQVIEADSALVTAQSEFAAALVALYRATGVY